jgi:ATP/maltotriose-dependent transcriptional regulator MalT
MLGRGADWDMLDRAVELQGSERPVPLYLWPSAIRALLKLWVGRYEEARVEFTALRHAASDSGDESDLAYLLTWLAALEIVSGDLHAAEALADEAVTHANLAGSEFNRAWALSQRVTVRAYRGDAEAARADAAEVTAICARFEAPLPMLWAGAAIGVLELSLGDAGAAWNTLAPYAEALAARGGGEAFAIVIVPAIEALIARGELETAERRLDRLEDNARDNDRRWARAEAARCRALLLAAGGDLPAAALAAERALEHHARAELPFERARALLVQGQIARRRKQKRAARESLEAALALFEELGAREWAERTREDIARLGRKRQTELTASETRVARLAADGLANKEIASALFVTVHTVEVHLSRAYAKLGIRRRGELAARLGEV